MGPNRVCLKGAVAHNRRPGTHQSIFRVKVERVCISYRARRREMGNTAPVFQRVSIALNDMTKFSNIRRWNPSRERQSTDGKRGTNGRKQERGDGGGG